VEAAIGEAQSPERGAQRVVVLVPQNQRDEKRVTELCFSRTSGTQRLAGRYLPVPWTISDGQPQTGPFLSYL